jgi:hypothetical protein
MRALLYLASVLVLLAGLALFVLTDHTERLFAWTIEPGMTAAFLGASYLGAFFLEFLSARERAWARARPAIPAVFVFTVLTLVATLVHRDRFHFDSPHVVAKLSAWAWLAIYIVVPVLMVIVWIAQARVSGVDPPRTRRLPAWVAVVIGALAAALLVLGAALLVAPADTADLWPWTLTPLTARAVGAWLVGIGVAGGHALLEADVARLRAGSIGFLTLGVFNLIAVARYAGDVAWGRAGAWVFLAFLGIALALGGFGWRLAERARASAG